MLTLAQIVEALGDTDCYGSEEPPERFETLDTLSGNINVTGFDCMNEIIGFRLFDSEEQPGAAQLLVTVALPRKGVVVDWDCLVQPGEEEALLTFLGSCRRRALERTAVLWPEPPRA